LSAEYEALCTSKSTLNKSLCRETMSQLPKFESDINTYFKEKFKIEGFKLTGIHFPYGEINHGGLSATFQLESDPYVMLTDTFDYDKGVYKIRPATNEINLNAGQSALSFSILDSEFTKRFPINQIEFDMTNLGFYSDEKRLLYYGVGGNYFPKHNLVNKRSYLGANSQALENDKSKIIANFQSKLPNTFYVNKYKKILIEKYRFSPMTYVKTESEIKALYVKYIEFIEKNEKYREILEPRIIFYFTNDLSAEKFINLYDGKIQINE
ncbi:MAG: hypothetical protein ACRCV7_02625, partial [Culicoidibacterales bacterium]